MHGITTIHLFSAISNIYPVHHERACTNKVKSTQKKQKQTVFISPISFLYFQNGDPLGRRSYARSDTLGEIQTKRQKNQKHLEMDFQLLEERSGMWSCVSNSQGFHNEAQMKLREALLVTYVGKYVYPATLTLNC